MKKNTISNKSIFRGLCTIVFTIVSSGVFAFAWISYIRHNNHLGNLLNFKYILLAVVLFAIFYYLFGRWLLAFSIGIYRKSNLLSSQILALFLVSFFEIFISCVICGQFSLLFDFLRLYAMIFFALCIVNCILVLLLLKLYKALFPPTRIFEIYGKENNLRGKFSNVAYKYDIEKSILYSELPENLEEEISQYDAVLINDVPEQVENRLLKICFKLDIRIYFAPRISDILVKGTKELNLFDTPIFFNPNVHLKLRHRIEKRLFDIAISSIMLLVLSPIFLIVAVAIHFDDKGPIFYKQERETLNGRHFMIIKFRSMIVDAEKDGKPHPAGEKDDRITKVGRIIRSCRIDELPQLINIFKGDMSIVGPRPERYEHCDKYRSTILEWDLRNKVRGGLTGYAQVYGKYNTTALDKLKFDLIYITNYSFVLDLSIMFQTLKVLTQKESTEGFNEKMIENIQDDK